MCIISQLASLGAFLGEDLAFPLACSLGAAGILAFIGLLAFPFAFPLAFLFGAGVAFQKSRCCEQRSPGRHMDLAEWL